MNTPVSFPIAKLLKEKGFDELCKLCVEDGDERPLPFNCGNTIHRNSLHPYYSAPTIAEVVMWLYEKHGTWIAVNRVVIGSDEWDYGYIISYLPKEYEFEKRRSKHLVEIQSFKEGVGSYHGAWYTPTEAYEAAIEYTLKNLI